MAVGKKLLAHHFATSRQLDRVLRAVLQVVRRMCGSWSTSHSEELLLALIRCIQP